MIKTLITNWRDILTGLALILTCSFLADAFERITLTNAGTTWLNNTTGILRGLARFGAANMSAFLILAIAWPSVNMFSNASFMRAWDSFTSEKKLIAFLFLAGVYVLAASICFAG